MAARNTSPFSRTMNREQITITGKFVGAAAANPTNVRGVGVSSVLRLGSGKYIIVLQDRWNGVLMPKFQEIDSTGLKHVHFTVSNVTLVNNTYGGVTTVTVEVFAGATTVAPARADLATTDTACFELTMSNTAQTPNGN